MDRINRSMTYYKYKRSKVVPAVFVRSLASSVQLLHCHNMYTSVPAARPSARTTAFQKQHLLEFRLKVNQVDETTGHVSSARCQFCVYYGREQILGQKRQRQPTTTIKHWNSPF